MGADGAIGERKLDGLGPLRLTVLGSGSVGLAVAASFMQAGLPVTLLARRAALAQLRASGLTVTGVSGEHHLPPERLHLADSEQPEAADIACDLLVVATKAHQVAPALRQLLQPAGAASAVAAAPQAVLLLQNGWGSADEARAVLPPGVGVFSSVMKIGIERRTPAHVNVNVQAGPIRVGTLFGAEATAMRSLVARAQAGFLPIVYDDETEAAILDKFLFNTCLNAVGAITRMTYGELVGNTPALQLIAQLADETLRAVHAERGVMLARDGAHYVEQTLRPLVLPRGAAHRSSMLQDVEAGRRTEIDYLNGAVVRMGSRHGIATPANEAVACLIRAREAHALST